MTPYERGYSAGLKAAAALVPTDDTRELCCNGYDCECRKPEDAANVSTKVEARRIKQAILSLPIEGEADQRGAAFGSAKPVSAGSNASQEASVSPAAQYVPHPNPGEQVAYPVRDGSKHLPEVSLDLTPARPGPSQECVMVPLLAWEYAITRLRGLHGLRLEGEPKPIDNAHFFKLLAAREE